MKFTLLLSFICAAFAKDISQFIEQKIEAESNDEVGIAYQIYENQHMLPMPDRNGVITGPDFRFQLTPGALENQGMMVNQPQAMESMPVRFPGVNMGPGMNNMYPGMNQMYPGMNNMDMNQMYPGMGMNSMNPGMNNGYPGYPGYYQSQGVSRTDSCGCSSSCGMPCVWWSCIPCNPCPPCNQPTIAPTTTTQQPTTTQTPLPTFPQEIPTQAPPSNPCPCPPSCPPCMPWFPCNPCNMCPCQTTPGPDNNTPPTQIPTTTTLPPTTTLQTVTQEIPTQPPSNCVPCRPCMPCNIWWMCPPCGCNNGCQTVPPAPTVSPTIAPPSNNCPCICAPCNPWTQNCPPCPSNCPCN